MKWIIELISLSLLVLVSYTLFGQSFQIVNKYEVIKVTIKTDSLIILIENNSDKTLYIPHENSITQNYSKNEDCLLIDFGIDLHQFNEIQGIALTEIKPNEKKSFSSKINRCSKDKIIFKYQFYVRKSNLNSTSNIIYNSDFISDKKWLKKGDWEWGELSIRN